MQRAVIHHGDCLDVMRGMASASVDLVLADPPYFRVKGEWWDRQWRNAPAFLAWLGTVADEWRRVLKPNGSLYCFTSPDMNARVETLLCERFAVLNNVRWYKTAGWHQKTEKESLRSYLTPWEGVIFAEQMYGESAAADASGYYSATAALHRRVYAPIGRVVAEKRLAAGFQRHEVDTACAPSRKPTGLCYRWEEGACLPTLTQWVDLCRLCGDGREYEDLRREYEDLRREYEDLRRPFTVTAETPHTDLWTFDPVAAYPGKHPCEKPQALLRHAITASSRPGAVVLDSFAGSGATGEAALATGRVPVLIEISAQWCERAASRLTPSPQLSLEPAA